MGAASRISTPNIHQCADYILPVLRRQIIMRVLELPQGYYRDLTGTTLVQALLMFDKDDSEFLQRHPQCVPYHRPAYRIRLVESAASAPWGHEWYRVDADDKLIFHSAHYDSSD